MKSNHEKFLSTWNEQHTSRSTFARSSAGRSARLCLAGHPVQSGGRAQCNIKNERRPRRFISHFHFLITVSAYRGPALPPLPHRFLLPPSSPWRRALGSSFSFRIAPSRALPLSLLLSLSLYPVITSPIAFIDLPITVLSRYNGVAESGPDCHVRLHPATYMSEQERSPRGAAAVAAVAAAAAVLSIERTTFRTAATTVPSLTALSALSRFYYRTRRQEYLIASGDLKHRWRASERVSHIICARFIVRTRLKLKTFTRR